MCLDAPLEVFLMLRRVRMNQFRAQWLSGLITLAGAVALSCSSADSSGRGAAIGNSGPTATGSPGSDGSFTPNNGLGSSATGGASSGPAPLPPEVEVAIDAERPHAGDRFVYVPNPASDNVAVIDADTLAIRTVEVGDEPRYLETLGGKDVAIVLNVLSDDAHILRTDPSGQTVANRLAVLAGSNAIAVAPDGKHAVTYFDATRGINGRTGSFQDVSLITIGEDASKDRAVGVSVGFRPSRVFFNTGATKAFVVTEDGVSILDFAALEQGGITKTVSIAPREKAKALDVSVTPNGKYALGRVPGESSLRLVDLEAQGEPLLLELKDLFHGAPTLTGAAGMAGAAGSAGASASPPPVPVAGIDLSDVDLSANGQFALAVVRNLSAVLQIPVPGGFTDPSKVRIRIIDGETIGSVVIAPDASKALLYTTASPTIERVTTLDLVSDTTQFTVQDLRKSALAVAISDNSQTALVVHDKVAGDPAEPGIDQDVLIDRSFGYSVIKLDTGFAKLQLTQAAVGPFSITPDSSALFLLFNSSSVQEIQRVGLDNFGVTKIALGSPPVSLGAVPRTKKMFVGQQHPDGRITFVDFAGLQVESVTGFEKNSRIRE